MSHYVNEKEAVYIFEDDPNFLELTRLAEEDTRTRGHLSYEFRNFNPANGDWVAEDWQPVMEYPEPDFRVWYSGWDGTAPYNNIHCCADILIKGERYSVMTTTSFKDTLQFLLNIVREVVK